MTGFGRAEEREDASRIVCEIRSVNHRFLTVKFRLPPFLLRYEIGLEKRLKKVLKRGSVEVFVQFQARGQEAVASFDSEVADRYLRTITRWMKQRALGTSLSASEILPLPGVIVPPDPADQASKIRPRLERVFDGAVEALHTMRGREGDRLKKVLSRELVVVERGVREIRKWVPIVVEEQHRRLRDRLAKLLPPDTAPVGDPAVARELALFADRADVTEELDRIQSHVVEFRRFLGETGSVGRSLDFLVQEFGREFNTIGSKSQDPRVMSRVLAGKTAVERIREQVQNVE